MDDTESRRWRQIEELYHSVLERDPAERKRLLEQANPELRREVESLLAQQSGEGILHHSVWDKALPAMLTPADTRLPAGSQLGRYTIESVLGEGGMGTVYKARDGRLGRLVAIKVCKEQFSARFEQEARAISALNHPNVCTLYDVGPNYLVMEFVEGPTLATRIEKGAIPLAQSLNIARQIASALDAAHEIGIVHRDLKPRNIHIKLDGTVKVLDFGLAKLNTTMPDANPTNAGTILGTASYMAPEQARGEPVDKRADIWAFGVLLCEMLTRKRVYDGQTASDILAAVVRDNPNLNEVPLKVRPLLKR